MFILVSLLLLHTIAAIPCPANTCSHVGVNCITNCSTQFCLCGTIGLGSIMTTAAGTVCYNDYQIYETDYRCILNSFSPTPDPTSDPTPSSPSTALVEYPACTCTSPGVQCITQCEPFMCLCGSNLVGKLLPTAPSTVCADGYQVWESNPVCSTNTQLSTCIDGFYCTSQCSLTYYQCSNGIPSATMMTPYGTVCNITQNNTGELIYPNYCNTTNMSCTQPGLQCVSECGTSVQFCMNSVGYALQMVPNGLLCYNNMLVLSSQPACFLANHSVPSVLFDITVQADNTSWSVLSDNTVAASVVDSIASVGSNVPITQEMVSVSNPSGRRLLQDQVHRTIAIYAPAQWDSSVVVEILNDSSGSSLLANSLQFRSYQLASYSTQTSLTTPTPKAVANFRVDVPNRTMEYSQFESIMIGSFLGGGMFIGIVFVLLRRYCSVKRADGCWDSTVDDTDDIINQRILEENTLKNKKGDTV